jgi:hypothetical protein
LSLVDGCETWSVVVREEHRLKIFKSRALRKVFAAKREREREYVTEDLMLNYLMIDFLTCTPNQNFSICQFKGIR